jgi:hypothetical protein
MRFRVAISTLLATALVAGGCSQEHDHGFRPSRQAISGHVRLVGQLTNTSGQWIGTRTVDDADGVPVELEFGDQVIATTTTTAGAFRFTGLAQGSYRVRARVPAPLAVRSSIVTIANADVAIGTPLTLESVGDLFPWPNPPGLTTQTLDFQVRDTMFVRMSIVDPGGRRVRLLQQGVLYPGFYPARWAGLDSLGTPVTGRYYWATFEAWVSSDGPHDERAQLLFR